MLEADLKSSYFLLSILEVARMDGKSIPAPAKKMSFIPPNSAIRPPRIFPIARPMLRTVLYRAFAEPLLARPEMSLMYARIAGAIAEARKNIGIK